MKILPNRVAVIEGDTHFGKWVEEHNSIITDPWFASFITAQINNHHVTLAIDAGANIGTLTVPMLETGCEVIAIEANPKAAECLLHNTAWANRLTIIEAGIGAEPGVMFIEESPNAGATRLTKAVSGASCPIITIDSLEVNPGLIKADIEGMELAMLRSAVDTIRRCRPVMILEVNAGAMQAQGDTPEELFEWLKTHGYGFRILQPDCQFGDQQFDIFAEPLT